jgi:hypothetical protein
VSKQSSVSSTPFGYTGWWRLLPRPSYSDLANNLFASASNHRLRYLPSAIKLVAFGKLAFKAMS